MSHASPERTPLSASILVSPARVARLIAVVVVGLLLTHAAAEFVLRHIDPEAHRGLFAMTSKFVLDSELNIPTWYQSASLMGCAVLLAVIGRSRSLSTANDFPYWAILALVFALLSVEEIVGVHELFSVPLRRRLSAHGLFYFAWVIPGLLVVGLLGVSYVRFLWRLNARTRWLFLGAACLYLSGAIGLEMVGGLFAERTQFQGALSDQLHVSLAYLIVSAMEECLEMAGVGVFLYALLDYLAGARIRFYVEFHRAEQATRVTVPPGSSGAESPRGNVVFPEIVLLEMQVDHATDSVVF